MIQDPKLEQTFICKTGSRSLIHLDKEWQCSDHWKAGEGYPWDSDRTFKWKLWIKRQVYTR